MKTLVEIINFIENLKKDYAKERESLMWHAVIEIGYRKETLTFFFDDHEDTIEIRAEVMAELGKPTKRNFDDMDGKYKAYTIYEYTIEEDKN